jgi:hypothetical protein
MEHTAVSSPTGNKGTSNNSSSCTCMPHVYSRQTTSRLTTSPANWEHSSTHHAAVVVVAKGSVCISLRNRCGMIGIEGIRRGWGRCTSSRQEGGGGGGEMGETANVFWIGLVHPPLSCHCCASVTPLLHPCHGIVVLLQKNWKGTRWN